MTEFRFVLGVSPLLDRSIVGAFHKVSKKHLHRYLGEFEWRYNNRDNEYLFRDTVLELIGEQRLEYASLINPQQPSRSSQS